jgi:flagellar basal-body rod protein FlgB
MEGTVTIFENVFGIHESALKLRERRLNVLSENIANADTPNYKARDIDFKSVMRATQSGTKDMAMTHKSHIDAGTLGKDGLVYRNPLNPSADGNTVELSVQQAEFGKESTRYTATMQFIENRIGGVRRALRGE